MRDPDRRHGADRRHWFAAIMHAAGRHGGAILGVCCAAVLWVGVAFSLSAQKQQAISAVMQNTANLSKAYAESTAATVDAIDQTLIRVREAGSGTPAASTSPDGRITASS